MGSEKRIPGASETAGGAWQRALQRGSGFCSWYRVGCLHVFDLEAEKKKIKLQPAGTRQRHRIIWLDQRKRCFAGVCYLLPGQSKLRMVTSEFRSTFVISNRLQQKHEKECMAFTRLCFSSCTLFRRRRGAASAYDDGWAELSQERRPAA